VAATLSRLRRDLDIMPSPVPDRPGLLIRDPFGYARATLIIPSPLVPCVAIFDGASSELDLRSALVRATGELQVGELLDQLRDTLGDGGFLENEAFERLREERQRAFVEAPVREPAHAGSGYPDDRESLSRTLRGFMESAPPRKAHDGSARGALVGIAAPHVSPEGGFGSYAAAYSELGPELADRTFVILGTSHYGPPERFGITRKPYRPPFGDPRVDTGMVDRLVREAGDAAIVEDYCHAVEHSIEFQVLFLQHAVAPDVRIVPILCGPFARSLAGLGAPEDDPGVRRMIGALGELAAREGRRVVFVLGIDMAHIGRRYGDRFAARAGQGRMQAVAEQDERRLRAVVAGDAGAFWDVLRPNGDELHWCGSAPLYAFLRAVRFGAGEVLRYEQWNIDAQSVVSFAGLAFREKAPLPAPGRQAGSSTRLRELPSE
jgi:MEMO1 family protein